MVRCADGVHSMAAQMWMRMVTNGHCGIKKESTMASSGAAGFIFLASPIAVSVVFIVFYVSNTLSVLLVTVD